MITVMMTIWIYEDFLGLHGFFTLNQVYSDDSDDYLVGSLEHEFYDFPYIGNIMIPTDVQSIIFQRGRSTTNQLYIPKYG